jgi:hypothetical protein
MEANLFVPVRRQEGETLGMMESPNEGLKGESRFGNRDAKRAHGGQNTLLSAKVGILAVAARRKDRAELTKPL